MICPKCGTANKEGAKFCRQCGSKLGDVATIASSSDEASNTPSIRTAKDEQAPETAPERTADPDPSKDDAPVKPTTPTAEAASGPSSPKSEEPDEPATTSNKSAEETSTASPTQVGAKDALNKIKSLPRPVLIGSVVAVVAIIAAIFIVSTSGRIGDKEIKLALQQHGDLTISGGNYDEDSELNVDSVKVTSSEKYVGEAAGMIKAWYGADEVYTATADVKLSNDAFEKTETVVCYFVKNENKWQPVDNIDTSNEVWTAKQGPSENKLSENLTDIVRQAFQDSGVTNYISNSTAPDAAKANSESYRDADITVRNSELDGNNATITIDAQKNGIYYTCGGTITANFIFDKGHWNLDSAALDDSATKIDFSGVVGTWNGTLTNASYKCGAAEGQSVNITISSFDASTGIASGTVTCVAHFHKSSESNTGVDTTLTDIPFSVKLKANCSKLSGEATIEQTGGKVYLEMDFDDPSTDSWGFGNSSSSSNDDANDYLNVDIETSPNVGLFSWSTYDDRYDFVKAE